MAEETITFDLIRKIQMEEARLPKLTKLPENFYVNVSRYINQKRKLAQGDMKGGVEIKNIERLAEDIFNRRERKILNNTIIFVRTGIVSENMTEEEKILFDKITGQMKDRRQEILFIMMEAETAEAGTMIMFKEDFSEFIGTDMKTYGPFKQGDIARIPDENKKLLLERGVIEELKTIQ
ncbi:MAG: DNA replication complex GINS family protein [Candidatus Aenigmarchaeota archaeon]|nr:DNA replication complex GINS family protein [Candidatus Aenigmarchaeota archaeon]